MLICFLIFYLIKSNDPFSLQALLGHEDLTTVQNYMHMNDTVLQEQKRKYSPGECCGAIKGTVCGEPDQKHISTSYVERQNLTMRMGMRRFTRLTNGFSKKIENRMAAISLHYMHYNFCRVHQTLRVTPAMAANVTDRLWEVSDLVAMLEADERGLERAA